LLEAIARGIDMFDCVMPTRSGRHCQAFTWGGKLNLRNARYADDPSPLDAQSSCPAAQYSRAYLHHLVKCGEDAWAHAALMGKRLFLSGADGRARGHRARRVRRLRRDVQRRYCRRARR
jgi:queuine tRNA-ribosyltransferase